MRFDFVQLWQRGHAPVFRPARKADRSVVERLEPSQSRTWLEAPPRLVVRAASAASPLEQHSEHVLEHYLERDGQLVGFARAARATLDDLPHPWWLATGEPKVCPADAGEALVGLETVVFGEDDAALARAAALLATLRRNQVLEAGLRRWVCCAPLPGYARWHERFCPQGYVQQVESGALFDPSLTPRLEDGARVVAVVDDGGLVDVAIAGRPSPVAWLAWESPVR